MSKPMDTSQWLQFFQNAGLPSNVAADYANIFYNNRIQADMLLDLSKEYLNDMNIKLVGDVIAILRYAKEFHNKPVNQDTNSDLDRNDDDDGDIKEITDFEGETMTTYRTKLNFNNLFPKVYQSKENPDTNHPCPLKEGIQKLKNEDLPAAILMFQAAVQRNFNDVKAWELLGSTQAKNHDHGAAMTMAMIRCLELEPTNLSALITLAFSSSYEDMPLHACDSLLKWLHYNPKYSYLVPSVVTLERVYGLLRASVTARKHYKNVLAKFREAANLNPSNPDPDVLMGLQILNNIAYKFEETSEVKPDVLIEDNVAVAAEAPKPTPYEKFLSSLSPEVKQKIFGDKEINCSNEDIDRRKYMEETIFKSMDMNAWEAGTLEFTGDMFEKLFNYPGKGIRLCLDEETDDENCGRKDLSKR